MSFIALMLRINGCLRQPFQALRALTGNQKRASLCAVVVTSQPKLKLQGSVCAAGRASRSDDETGGKPADQACLILMDSLLFQKPLKLTIYRPGQTGGTTKHRRANFHRREAFFAQLSFPERKRVLNSPLRAWRPARRRAGPPQPAGTGGNRCCCQENARRQPPA